MKLCPTCQKLFFEDLTFCPEDGASLIPEGDDLQLTEIEEETLVGTILDERYEVIKVLGRGGMGIVYQARQISMNRMVALKVLRREFTQNALLVKRFLREVQVASRLRHPHTITIYDFARSSHGILYFSMELLEGESLADLLDREKRLECGRALRLLLQVLGSLAEAHQVGIVHRDMKPENIFISQAPGLGDFVKVLDFGIAKVAEPENENSVTRTGHIFGTPLYMAPEQIRGEPLDLRTDLYALGVILYQLVTGALPFSAATPMGTMTRHLLDEPPPFARTAPELGLPEELEQLTRRLLEKDRIRRFPDAQTLSHAIEELLQLLGQPLAAPAPPISTQQPVPTQGSSVAGPPLPVGGLREEGQPGRATVSSSRVDPALAELGWGPQVAMPRETSDPANQPAQESATGQKPPVFTTLAGLPCLVTPEPPVAGPAEEDQEGPARSPVAGLAPSGAPQAAGRPARLRRRLLLAGGLLLLGAAGLLAYHLSNQHTADPEPASGHAQALRPNLSWTEPSTMASSCPADLGATGDPLTRDAGATRSVEPGYTLRLSTKPAGALIKEGNRRVGKTPYAGPAPPTRRIWKLTLSGYREETVVIEPGRDLELTRILQRELPPLETLDDFKDVPLNE